MQQNKNQLYIMCKNKPDVGQIEHQMNNKPETKQEIKSTLTGFESIFQRNEVQKLFLNLSRC